MSWECPLDFENSGRFSNPYTAAIQGTSTGESVASIQKWLSKLDNTRKNSSELSKLAYKMLLRAIEVRKLVTGTYEANKGRFNTLHDEIVKHVNRLGDGDSAKDPEWDDVKRQFMAAVLDYNAALETKDLIDEKAAFFKSVKDRFITVIEHAESGGSKWLSSKGLWIGVGVVVVGGFVLWAVTRPSHVHVVGGESAQ